MKYLVEYVSDSKEHLEYGETSEVSPEHVFETTFGQPETIVSFWFALLWSLLRQRK